MKSGEQIRRSRVIERDLDEAESYPYGDILERSTTYVLLIDRSLRVLYATPIAIKRMGLTPETMVGRTFEELGLDSETIRDYSERLNHVFDYGVADSGEASIMLPDGKKFFKYDAVPLQDEDGRVEEVVVTAKNITKAKTSDLFNEALNRIHSAINSTLSYDEIMRRVMVESSKTIRSDATALALRKGEEWILKYAYGMMPQRIIGRKMTEEEIRATFLPPISCPVGVRDCMKENWINPELMNKFHISSFLSVPLKARGHVVGILIFAFSQPRNFSREEMDFVEKLAVTASMSLENSQLYRHEREQRFLMQTILDNVPAVIVAIDGKDLRIKWANEASRKYKLGDSKDNGLEGVGLQDILPDAEKANLGNLLRSVVEKGRTIYDQEFALLGLGPEITYWRGALVPIKNAESETPDLLILAIDISDQVRARKELEQMAKRSEEEKNRLNAILETLPVGVMIADRSGRIVQMNGAAQPFWDSISPSLNSIYKLEDIQAWHTGTGDSIGLEDWGIARALFHGERRNNDLATIRTYDGRLVTILISAAPIRDAEGRVIGAAGVFQDITKQLGLEHEVVEAKARAEQYLDVLTHDIGNLNAPVVGYLQLLQDQSDLGDKEKEWIRRSLRSLEESARLIENIRTIQQVKSSSEIVSIDKMLERVVREYSRHPSRDITISLSTVGQHCTLGNGLLKEVFSNIVDNSIKHSSDRLRVNIRVSEVLDLGLEHHRIEFEDDGPGIPDDLKSRIFSRTERGRTKAVGMGLGLFLVKRLIEDFSGRVWVEDRVPGDHTKGARFVVMLPAAPCKLISKGEA